MTTLLLESVKPGVDVWVVALAYVLLDAHIYCDVCASRAVPLSPCLWLSVDSTVQTLMS